MSSTSTTMNVVYGSVGSLAIAIFYAYWREGRTIADDALIPDETRKEVIPSQELGWWLDGKQEEKFANSVMMDLHSYLSVKPLKVIPFEARHTQTDALQLRCLDAGCGTAGILFRLASNENVIEGVGLDISQTCIRVCNEKKNGTRPLLGYSAAQQPSLQQLQQKLNFFNKDCCHLSEYADNYFDIGYSILVMHDMPHRVPVTMLCELSRVCKYLVVLDWSKDFFHKLTKAGFTNARVEFMVGPKHFSGFRHFLKLGGVEAHIQSLMKHRSHIETLLYKTLDSSTMGFYILDTRNAQKMSKM